VQVDIGDTGSSRGFWSHKTVPLKRRNVHREEERGNKGAYEVPSDASHS